MDFSTWRPHGLVLEWGMESLYLSARITLDPNGNIIDPKEHYTVALFEFLFHRHIFTGTFMCFSQHPPNISSRKACDLVIKHLTDQGAWQVACFAEAKRANNQTGALVTALETQAEGYCKDYLNANDDVDLIYACTMVGTSIRCWWCRPGEGLTGFWNGGRRNDIRYYLDIGLDENREKIMSAFNGMKGMPSYHLVAGTSHADIGAGPPS